jgi:restriction system protein
MIFQAPIKGFFGELRSQLCETLFLDSKEYHCYDNVIVPAPGGTTQIDHVIVSKYGIFVVETKNHTGWIFGNQDDKEWLQTYFGKQFRFQNPLHQNYRHTKSLSEYLGLDPKIVFSVIVFWGNFEFKTPMPENVLNNSYTGYIKSKKQILLTDKQVFDTCNILYKLKQSTPSNARKIHKKDLDARFSSTTHCPKCNGLLKEKTASRGPNAGRKFLGCENYPRCYYIKDIDY